MVEKLRDSPGILKMFLSVAANEGFHKLVRFRDLKGVQWHAAGAVRLALYVWAVRDGF